MTEYVEMKFDSKQGYYKRGIFDDEVILEDIKIFDEIKFEDCIFIKSVKCVTSIIENEILFEGCTFRQGINMNDAVFEKKVSFIDNDFEKNIDFLNTIFKYKLYIRGCKVVDIEDIGKSIKINFRKAKIFDLKLIECENVHLNFTKTIIEGYLNIKERAQKIEINFKEIRFVETHFTNNSKVTLENLNIEELMLDDYSNHAKNFKFKKLNIKKYILMEGIFFENEKFVDIDLKLCEKIRLKEVFITEKLFVNIEWGILNAERFCAKEKNFRELKDFSENKKNYKDAEGFYALEMKERKKNFIEKQKKFSPFQKMKHYFYNILILDINEITSDYFQNWILPLLWIFIFGMSAVLYKEYQELLLQNYNVLFVGISIVALLFTIYHYSKDFTNMIWIIFIALVIMYLWLGYLKEFEYLDKLVDYINPFKIFKLHLDSDNLTFLAFIYKIVILFLGYQFLMSIKKKVRNK